MIANDADSFRDLFENRRIRKLFGELGGEALTTRRRASIPITPRSIC